MPVMTQGMVDAAETIRQDLSRQVEAARSDQTLSPLGRQQRIAAAWLHAVTAMDGLRVNFEGGAALNAVDLQRQVFGTLGNLAGQDAISVRDAADRAAQLQDADEALAVLHNAEINGDTVLARAIAQRAFSASQDFGGYDWNRVLEAYTQTRPDIAAKLQQLVDLQANRMQDRLALAGYTYMLKPVEIERLTDGQLAELAGQQQG